MYATMTDGDDCVCFGYGFDSEAEAVAYLTGVAAALNLPVDGFAVSRSENELVWRWQGDIYEIIDMRDSGAG